MSIYRIAENGESKFHIVNHKYCDETVRFASSELQKYLLLSTGAIVPYFSDRCPPRGPEIRIGAFVRGETEWEKDVHPEGFVIKGDGENITITAKSSRGVLYGVYRFFEIFCNFRCFTKDVENIDKFSVLDIDLTEIKEEPSFDFRDAYFRNAFDGDFCAKNRLNSSVADISRAKGGRMKWFNFHHSFNDLVSDTLYFEKHPEYFSEIDGVRQKDSQLCLSNPDVLKIAEQTLRRWIKENPECKVFSVAQNDNHRRCTCPKCMEIEKQEGSPAGPIIHFVNKLADAIKEDYPDVLIHTFAYTYSLPAPKLVVARDNVIVRICSLSCRFDKPFEILARENIGGEDAKFVNAIHEWKTHAKNLYVWDYAVNFRNYPQPFMHLDVLKENINFFFKNGVRGVLEQGNFAYGGGCSGDDLKAYVIARLLWDVNADVFDEVSRFCDSVYGESAGKVMKEYYALLNDVCQKAPLSIYQFPDADYVDDVWVKRATKLLKKAKKLARRKRAKRRIEREELSIRFLVLTRMELSERGRNKKIQKFFEDLKSHGIMEIRERRPLKISKECLMNSRFAKDRTGEYLLYYIMQ